MEKLSIIHRPHGAFEEVQAEAYLRGRLPDGRPLYQLFETFYVGKKFLGGHYIEWLYTNGEQLSSSPSTAYFCSHCGDVWARRVTIPEWWCVVPRYCARHGDGSLITESELQILEHLPISIITYEFILASNKEQ